MTFGFLLKINCNKFHEPVASSSSINSQFIFVQHYDQILAKLTTFTCTLCLVLIKHKTKMNSQPYNIIAVGMLAQSTIETKYTLSIFD